MALEKNIISEYGMNCLYHKVEQIYLRDNILECTVASYASKEYREMNKPANRIIYQFDITIEEEESMGIRQLAYLKLKTLEEWSDAQDC